MFAVIYGYNYDETGRRSHLGNITDIEFDSISRTYSFSQATIKGKCDFELDKPLLYVIKDDRGKQIDAGFVKNDKVDNGIASFIGMDLKKILDSEIILDFTQELNPSHLLDDIFNKIANQVTNLEDPFINEISFDFTIPDDSSDTKIIANYTGQYIVVNVLTFLKVYLSYFGYHIKPTYNEAQDKINFEFVKQNDLLVEIKLKDFIHEKTGKDIKVNKAVATVKFDPSSEDATPAWELSDEAYWNSQPSSNRSEIVSSNLPDPIGYQEGYALKQFDADSLGWVESTVTDYLNADNTAIRTVPSNTDACPTNNPSFIEATTAIGDANNYTPNIVVKVIYYTNSYAICNNQYAIYLKASPGASATFYKINGSDFNPRPTIPSKVYTLGIDNNIYDGYAPTEKRIYPIITKVHEADYLSEAQINAVSTLVNSRYIENIIITEDNQINPIDLSNLELNTMIRVYDNLGISKDIPISEKIITYKKGHYSVKIKLGFKKTLLTEIIKTDLQDDTVIKKGSGSGGTTIVKKPIEIPLSTESEEPDPTDSNMWFVID